MSTRAAVKKNSDEKTNEISSVVNSARPERNEINKVGTYVSACYCR